MINYLNLNFSNSDEIKCDAKVKKKKLKSNISKNKNDIKFWFFLWCKEFIF